MLNGPSSIETNDKSLDLCEQISNDINDYLNKYANKNFGIRVLARETKLHEKTIKRLLKKTNKPTYQTIFKLYHSIYEEYEETELINLVSPLIKDELIKNAPLDHPRIEKKELDLKLVFEKEPLMAEFFVLAGTMPLSKNTIAYRFGQYGIELLEKMESLELLKFDGKETYILGKNIPRLDANLIKFLGTRFIDRFSKPADTENQGKNVMAFYAEGLNEEGIKEWLKIDTEAFKKKVQIAQNNKFKGYKPTFTFVATDTISWENENV